MRDDASEGVSQELWKQDAVEFLYTQGFGRSAYFMPEEKANIMDISMNNTAGNLKLDFQITKRDSKIPMGGDHKWTMIEHGKSVIELEYNDLKDCWHVKDLDYNIDNNAELYAVGSMKVVYTLSWE